MTARLLIGGCGVVYLVLGSIHGVLTLRDVGTPRAFTPTDDAVRGAMLGARVRFNPRMNLWRAWLGFNLSHSLGALVFGGGLVWIAAAHIDLFSASLLVQGAVIAVAASYFALAVGFWFWGPALGAGIGLASLITATVLTRLSA